MAPQAHSVDAVSKNLWRQSSLVPEGPRTLSGFGSMSNVQPDSINEVKYFQTAASRSMALPPSPIAGVDPQSLPPATNPLAGALAASMQRSARALDADLNDRSSKRMFAPISAATKEQLKSNNPIAYDRLVAATPEQQMGMVMAGPAEDAMLLIPPDRTRQSKVGIQQQPASDWEEVFAARRSPEVGPTTFSGLRLHNDEWYHFNGQVATPPNSTTGPVRSLNAHAASTTFAPVSLLKSQNPASKTNLDTHRVSKDVKGITEGALRPFLQGPTLKGSDHAVQGVTSSPKGFDAFKAAFDSVNGVLKKIQDVAKGIMKAADFLGMVGQLGQFGDVLKWIGALNLPKSPADLINSLILGKGILPGTAPPAPAGICNGSGEGGLVVTQNGAAAEHLGKGKMIDVKILQQQGDGSNAAKAKDTNAEVKHKPPANADKKPDDKKPDDKKTDDKKPDDKKPDDKKPDDKKPDDKKPDDKKPDDKKPDDKKPDDKKPENTASANPSSNQNTTAPLSQQIRQQALANKQAGMTDLDATVAAVEFGIKNGASLEDLNAVFSGHTGAGVDWTTLAPTGVDQSTFARLGCTGVDPALCDGSDSQMHHIWYYIQIGASQGRLASEAGNVYHELQGLVIGGGEASLADLRAGSVGSSIGADLAAGRLTLQDLPQRLRNDLSPKPPKKAEIQNAVSPYFTDLKKQNEERLKRGQSPLMG